MPLQETEVGVALGLNGQRRHLGIERLVDPDAAELQAIASRHLTESRVGQPALIPQVIHLHRQLDAELFGLHACQIAAF